MSAFYAAIPVLRPEQISCFSLLYDSIFCLDMGGGKARSCGVPADIRVGAGGLGGPRARTVRPYEDAGGIATAGG